MGPSARRLAFAAAFIVSAVAGCASPTDDGEDVAQGSSQAVSTTDGFVYFHGMSRLGFARDALRTGLGSPSLLAPAMSDAQLQDAVADNVVDPTYDGSYALGFGVGGGIARAWLDADAARSLLLVYGTSRARSVARGPT